ncbi:unnamed protein product [Notodromas monacha]|uniref:Tyrosine-protein phosphatase non-receptor type 9 n=1 Tax=Notodromas monacha TaxID=399045 RepID=A0A7R9BRW0_9CRUS|nr:unnamed protein product [Notodromas monacha]CAG0919033.1 unnamed protein product [Notodromas monacha]
MTGCSRSLLRTLDSLTEVRFLETVLETAMNDLQVTHATGAGGLTTLSFYTPVVVTQAGRWVSALSATMLLDVATKDFLVKINELRQRRNAGPVSWNTAVKFLMARKFNVDRAIVLFHQHETTRQREGLTFFNPLDDPLKSELESGKFTILPGKDISGATLALFTASLHYPQLTDHRTTLQGVVYQLDKALEDPSTQRDGLVFIYDMTESRYSNFDYELSQRILTLLKSGYPARLKKVLIVTAPLWFKAPFKILRLFVREKLRDRVYTVSVPQLVGHIPENTLPKNLGGESEVEHKRWLKHCLKLESNCSMASEFCTDSPTSVNFPPVVSANNDDAPAQSMDNGQSRRGKASLVLPNGHSNGDEPQSDSESNDNSPCQTPDSSTSPMTLQELLQHVKSRGKMGIYAEYSELKAKPLNGSFEASRQRQNLLKNRYTDVLCYDHTRVMLEQIDGDPSSDYINANYVDGYKTKKAFIFSQGPLQKTFPDFWRMIWEQRVLVLVMTTRIMERGRVKCGQYWPEKEGSSACYGFIRVENKAVDSTADYVHTIFAVINQKTEESREVHHMQFTSWPDYGLPESASAMLSFLKEVRRMDKESCDAYGWTGEKKPPILVHCSAGIGRTGTFCTLDICLQRLAEEGVVDIKGTVERIRSQRAHSIQMPDQYVFCYMALLEHAITLNLLPRNGLEHLHSDHEDSEED